VEGVARAQGLELGCVKFLRCSFLCSPLASSSSYIGVARIWLLVEVPLHDDSSDFFSCIIGASS